MKTFEEIERIRKTIDLVAYCSLFLDICIALITTVSILNIANPEPLLVPIHYMLTLVVIISIILFVTLLFLKREENILSNILKRRYRYRPKRSSSKEKIRKIRLKVKK